MTASDLPFWKQKTFEEMTPEEWESLCDGCARCCLYKLEDDDSGDIYFTNVVCKFLDTYSCRCREYEQRNTVMPTCILLTPQNVREITWLPSTCAYRLLVEGKDLEWWHPLISQSSSSVHLAGISVRDKAIPEDMIDMENLEDYQVDWLK